jgi:hypothetical protein
MAKLRVQPRPTPGERHDREVEVPIGEDITLFIDSLEAWTEPRPEWTFTLREGHDFGRTNNVEAVLLRAAGEQTSSLTFRLDQVDAVEEVGYDLVIRFEERDGIAKAARLTETGLDVELFHILTTT